MPGEPVAERRAQPVLAQGLDVDTGLPEDVEPRLPRVQVLGQGYSTNDGAKTTVRAVTLRTLGLTLRDSARLGSMLPFAI